MQIHYDEASDGLIIQFSDATPKMSTTIGQDTVLHRAENGQHVYLQIRNASRYVDNPKQVNLNTISRDEPPAGFIIVDREDLDDE